jgi:hypothetical protein
MAIVAWRVAVASLAGFVLGVVVGALVGDAATPDDFRIPVDWGFLAGTLIGAVVGTLGGIAGGVGWHLPAR